MLASPLDSVGLGVTLRLNPKLGANFVKRARILCLLSSGATWPLVVLMALLPSAWGVSACLAGGDAPRCHAQQLQKLIADDPSSIATFGFHLDFDGDTLAIGADHDDPGGITDAGSVYVFVQDQGLWSLQQKLVAEDPTTGAQFGRPAISGDTMIVGAWHDSSGVGNLAGSAYVFVLENGAWMQQAKLTSSDLAPQDLFGHSVAIHGDTVVVTARGDQPTGQGITTGGRGSAYVFHRTAGRWTEVMKIIPEDSHQFQNFGMSVAFDGTTIVVGAFGDSQARGATFLFEQSRPNQWQPMAKLVPADAMPYDGNGCGVAISGDIVLAGAVGDNPTGPGGLAGAGGGYGAAYVFRRTGADWHEEAKLISTHMQPLGLFGCSVAIDGDHALIGQRNGDFATGAPCGSVHLFAYSSGFWDERLAIAADDAAADDSFGARISLKNGMVVVGSPWDDFDGLHEAGSAYVFDVTDCTESSAADLNGDGVVNTLDLGILLSSWTIPPRTVACGGTLPCPADINDDGVVNTLDLGVLLSSWTP